MTATTDLWIALAYIALGLRGAAHRVWQLSDPKRDRDEAWWVR